MMMRRWNCCPIACCMRCRRANNKPLSGHLPRSVSVQHKNDQTQRGRRQRRHGDTVVTVPESLPLPENTNVSPLPENTNVLPLPENTFVLPLPENTFVPLPKGLSHLDGDDAEYIRDDDKRVDVSVAVLDPPYLSCISRSVSAQESDDRVSNRQPRRYVSDVVVPPRDVDVDDGVFKRYPRRYVSDVASHSPSAGSARSFAPETSQRAITSPYDSSLLYLEISHLTRNSDGAASSSSSSGSNVYSNESSMLSGISKTHYLVGMPPPFGVGTSPASQSNRVAFPDRVVVPPVLLPVMSQRPCIPISTSGRIFGLPSHSTNISTPNTSVLSALPSPAHSSSPSLQSSAPNSPVSPSSSTANHPYYIMSPRPPFPPSTFVATVQL
jgi:hypothetical protein